MIAARNHDTGQDKPWSGVGEEAAHFADRLEVRVGVRVEGRVLDLRIVRGECVLFDAVLEVAGVGG